MRILTDKLIEFYIRQWLTCNRGCGRTSVWFAKKLKCERRLCIRILNKLNRAGTIQKISMGISTIFFVSEDKYKSVCPFYNKSDPALH